MNLDWPECRNVRDLGGLSTSSGNSIRPRALIRADRLDQLNDSGRRAVRECGVSRILDLRRAEECRAAPNPFAADPVYRHMPVQDPTDADELAPTLTDLYLTMLDRRPRLFAGAVRAIADAPHGAVLVHCHAGKDRTGVVVALALTLAGVALDVIADDYAYSEVGLAEINARGLAKVDDADERDRLQELWSARPETMTVTLSHLDGRYGGVEKYLAAGGLTDSQADAIRARLLT